MFPELDRRISLSEDRIKYAIKCNLLSRTVAPDKHFQFFINFTDDSYGCVESATLFKSMQYAINLMEIKNRETEDTREYSLVKVIDNQVVKDWTEVEVGLFLTTYQNIIEQKENDFHI